MKWFVLPKHRYSARQIGRWLWKAWKGNWRQSMLNVTIGLLDVAASLTMVWAIRNAIDTATHARPGSVYMAVALMAALMLAEIGLSASRVWVKNILGVKAQNRMQQRTLDRLLRSEWRGDDTHHTGDVINRLEQDVQTVVVFLTEKLPDLVATLALFTGAFFYMLNMEPWLAIVTVGIMPLFIIPSRFYIAQMRRLSKLVRSSDSEIQSLLTETVQQRMMIKTMEAGALMMDRLDTTQSQLRENVRRRTKFSIGAGMFINIGFSLGYLIAFLWGALRLAAGTITFGTMTAFQQLVYRMQQPARDMTRQLPAFVAVFTAAERLMELEEKPEEEQGAPRRMEDVCGLRMENVCYRYADDERMVVDHLDFDFRPGTCTAVLGETGAGKTTLIRLMLALLKPTEGCITLYNNKGEAEPITPLHRCNFVYVPQGHTLLSGTVRSNLLLGNPNATDDEMKAALHAACADFVCEHQQGLDLPCNEQGSSLSEGQSQRIAIARALLRNRPVMLFDEATSALDPETERRLLENLLRDNRHTIIFITHRPAVVDYCDQTLRIE